MKYILKKHPDLDFFVGRIGGSIVPTKQDKFKPVTGYELVMEEDDGTVSKVIDEELYLNKEKGA